jgi:hypothetical protein
LDLTFVGVVRLSSEEAKKRRRHNRGAIMRTIYRQAVLRPSTLPCAGAETKAETLYQIATVSQNPPFSRTEGWGVFLHRHQPVGFFLLEAGYLSAQLRQFSLGPGRDRMLRRSA